MLHQVVQVFPHDDYTVHVYFDDGAIRQYDVSPLIGDGVFQKIADRKTFVELCTVINGTLAWDVGGNLNPYKCIDIDPETIYHNGTSTSDPLGGPN